MANQQLTWMERNNVTPGKLILIGLLAVVFLGVVGYQLGPLFFRGGPGVAVVATEPRRQREAAQATTNETKPNEAQAGGETVDKVVSVPRRNSVWPTIALEDAIRHDPFRMPVSVRDAILAERQRNEQPEVETESVDEVIARREALLVVMVKQGVDVVIVDGETAVAAIGELELRVGDVFDGLLVKSITRNGVELVRVNPQSGQGEP